MPKKNLLNDTPHVKNCIAGMICTIYLTIIQSLNQIRKRLTWFPTLCFNRNHRHITEWMPLPKPELLTMASCRKDQKRISAESSVISPRQPSQPGDWTELHRAFSNVQWVKTAPYHHTQMSATAMMGVPDLSDHFWALGIILTHTQCSSMQLL